MPALNVMLRYVGQCDFVPERKNLNASKTLEKFLISDFSFFLIYYIGGTDGAPALMYMSYILFLLLLLLLLLLIIYYTPSRRKSSEETDSTTDGTSIYYVGSTLAPPFNKLIDVSALMRVVRNYKISHSTHLTVCETTSTFFKFK